MDRIRVASLQYYIRPIKDYSQFAEQVSALVETARDYKAQLVVFPEYFTVQLLTLSDIKRPIHLQVRELAKLKDKYLELFTDLSKKHKIYILAGTIPALSDSDPDKVFNDSYFFSPQGNHGVQGKLHMTRFEKEEWFVSARKGLKIFETSFGKVAVTICYDVEFPELARSAAKQGATILITPSCTDDRQGFLRVRYCAHARAIENQMYVIHSPTVGSLPMVPAISLNYGQAAILTPSDFAFARDGILAEGNINQETIVIGELNLKTIEESRHSGTVLPLKDSQTTAEVLSKIESVNLG